MLETAIKIYPQEANLYDSIARFYMNLDQREKAIEFYTKALEVDPNYPNADKAKESLQKLRQK